MHNVKFNCMKLCRVKKYINHKSTIKTLIIHIDPNEDNHSNREYNTESSDNLSHFNTA